MTTQLLRLPFCYRAAILPSSRHTRADIEFISEYTDVLVPELSATDAVIAIEYDGYEALEYLDPLPGPIYLWNGRLYRGALPRGSDVPLKAAAFEEAVSARFDHFISEREGRLSPFRSELFPVLSSPWGDCRARNPLDCHDFERRARERRWKPTRKVLESDREARLGSAQSFLSEAVVLIEGHVFVACPEPAWSVDAYGAEAIRVRLDPDLRYGRPTDLFRLDRVGEAMEWARRLGGNNASPPEVRISEACILCRDDEWALANHLVASCSYLRGPFGEVDEAHEPLERAGMIVQGIRDEKRMPYETEVEDILEALETSLQAALPEGLTGHDRTDRDLRLVADRWALAKVAGRGPGNRMILDEIDRDALIGAFDDVS